MIIPLRHYTETRVNNVRYYELTCPVCLRKVTLELERNSY